MNGALVALLLASLGTCISETFGVEAPLSPHNILGGELSGTFVGQHVVLLEVHFSRNSYTCTGSVIGQETVISAAHCFTKPGQTLTKVNLFPGPVQVLKEKKYVADVVAIHKKYSALPGGRATYDIALLHVASGFDSKSLKTVTLSTRKQMLKNGQKAWATAWGTFTSFLNKESKFLIQTRMTQRKFRTCKRISSRRTRKSVDGKKNICVASAEFSNTAMDGFCSGVSGGPLFTLENGRFVQYGVLSRGQPCGSGGRQVWYVKVAAFLKDVAEFRSHEYSKWRIV